MNTLRKGVSMIRVTYSIVYVSLKNETLKNPKGWKNIWRFLQNDSKYTNIRYEQHEDIGYMLVMQLLDFSTVI